MTPQQILAAEEREFTELLARKVSERACEYHGRVWHALDENDDLRCIPCVRERLDSMGDALRSWKPEVGEPEEGEPGYRCPGCGEPYDSKCRTARDAVCFSCRNPEGER